MNIKLTLSDSDVIFMDDTTGDIKLSRDVFPEELEQGSTVTIHFNEDSDNTDHIYHVKTMNDLENTVELAWEKQIDKTLTEANPLNLFKKKSFEDRVADKNKKHAKEVKKILKSADALVARDLDKEFEDRTFYLQNPDGTYQKGQTQAQVRAKYSKGLTPEIANAIVVTPMGYLERKGLQDFSGQGVKYDKNDVELDPKYAKEWPEEEIKKYKATQKRADKKSLSKQDQDNSLISDKLFDKFKKLASVTGMHIEDSAGKELNPDKLELSSIDQYKVKVGSNEGALKDWITNALKHKLISESMLITEELKTLLESPVLKLDDEDTYDPKDFNIQRLIKKSQAKEAEKIARMNKEAAEAELKKVYDVVMPKFHASIRRGDLPEKTLDILFDDLVPSEGPAASVAGEMVRAMMRILYRDYNDGDKFFEGYGIETCASSAEYLFDNGFAEEIQNILDNAYYLEDDTRYTDAINNLAEKVVNRIKSDNSLIYTVNDIDSRDYSVDYIKEHQPTYDIEISGSDDIVNLVENGVLNAWDLNEYVEHILSYENYFEGAVVDRPWSHDSTNVSVSNLTRDGYDELENRIQNNLDGFWADLVAEYADELTNDYDDDYEEEEQDDE